MAEATVELALSARFDCGDGQALNIIALHDGVVVWQHIGADQEKPTWKINRSAVSSGSTPDAYLTSLIPRVLGDGSDWVLTFAGFIEATEDDKKRLNEHSVSRLLRTRFQRAVKAAVDGGDGSED